MINPALLSDTEVANILKCSISELPQRQQAGEIECVQLRDRQLYRLVAPKQYRPGGYSESNPSSDSAKKSSISHPVNTESLIRQYEDRGKIIHLLEKNHSLYLKKLFSKIKRLRQHRLTLVITLEVLCGAGIIIATLATDKINEAKSQSADMYLMAQHDQQQVIQIQQDQQEMDQQYQKIANHLKENQLEQARLEVNFSIQEIKIQEARKMISRLIEVVELSDIEVATKSRYSRQSY